MIIKRTWPILEIESRLWKKLNTRRHIQLVGVFLLMIVASIFEVVSIGLVLPFLSALTAPEIIYKLNIFKEIWPYFYILEASQVLLPLTILFCIAALIAGGLRVLLLWANTRVSYAIGSDFSIQIYGNSLYKPYQYHLGVNSSDLINGVINETGIVIFVVSATLNILSCAVVLMFVLSAIIYVDPLVALTIFGGFGVIYTVIVGSSRKKLKENGNLVSIESSRLVKCMQEGIGSIRDVILNGLQEVYISEYTKSDRLLRRAIGNTIILGHSPRYIMEALGILLLASIAYFYVGKAESVTTLIPFLGAIALGAQKVLPLLQQAYSSWAGIQGNIKPTMDVLNLLDGEPVLKPKFLNAPDLKFEKEIELLGVSFSYDNDINKILNNVNLTIKKGEWIGFVGKTGSGKSTLIDLIMGLLKPTEGKILVDGIDINSPHIMGVWQKKIAHVPQNIHLSDMSIIENIGIGQKIEEIDKKIIDNVISTSQLISVTEVLAQGYCTVVGEKGARLSGGQIQRIGIARALYRNCPIMVFDEATSALDSETEMRLIRSLENNYRNLTVILIAHRTSTLKNCENIYEIVDGSLRRVN
jgi:ATP-binding cassette subfamily B protein